MAEKGSIFPRWGRTSGEHRIGMPMSNHWQTMAEKKVVFFLTARILDCKEIADATSLIASF